MSSNHEVGTPDAPLEGSPAPATDAELAEHYRDKAEGLSADLDGAVEKLWEVGGEEGREWVGWNYAKMAERLRGETDAANDIEQHRSALFSATPATTTEAVFAQIVEYAVAIAFQAGVGSSETAGVIVSFLARRPELLTAFMRGELSATDSGMLDHHNGALTRHGADGNVHGPDPSKARFPAEREVVPIAFDLSTFTSDARAMATSEVEPEDIHNGAVDARLWWFLHVLEACGKHGTAANDYNGEWVAAFCGDFHPTDTFNRACNLKLAICTHNSMDETFRIWITEAGKAWVAERSSIAAKEVERGLR